MKKRLAIGAAVLVALAAAGIAYATIPDEGGVYTACELNGVGTIRLIDPSLSAKSLLGHCTALETQVSWNQKGQPGAPGAPGVAGPKGDPGVSPTVAQLAVGDVHCANGGAAITGASGSTAYVCSGTNGTNGTNGADGQPFSGTFTSPNGTYSITVADTGIVLRDGTSRITIADGALDARLNDTVALRSGTSLDVRAGTDANLRAGSSVDVQGGFDASVRAGATASLSGGGVAAVSGALTQLGTGACLPAARVSDQVQGTSTREGTPFVGTILSGAPDVCVG